MSVVNMSFSGMKPGGFTPVWGIKYSYLPESIGSTGTFIPTKSCENSYPKELRHITLRSLAYCV